MRRGLLYCSLLPMALALAWVTPAPALADVIAAEPVRPGGNVPFDLVFAGDWEFTELDSGIEPRLEVEDTTVRITVPVGPAPPITPPLVVPYGFTVRAPSLFAGAFGKVYDVELWVDRVDDGGMTLWSSDTVEVVPGVEVLTVTKRPSDIRPVTLLVRGFASCYVIGEPVIRANTVTIPFGYECSILPPPPERFAEQVELGTLPAGDYRVVVGEPGSIEYGRHQLTVLPVEVSVLEDRFDISVTRFSGDAALLAEPARQPSDDSALFWFFDPENWEVMVKVLDGCAINGHYWVFGAASTDVHYLVSVTDTVGTSGWTFENPAGERSPAFSDTEAFPCS